MGSAASKIPIRQLAIAIGKAEGYGVPGSQATTRKNPGNIRCGKSFCWYKTEEEGYKAVEWSIRRHASFDRTLQEMINVYSPAADNNNPIQHANNIARFAGIDKNIKLNDLLL